MDILSVRKRIKQDGISFKDLPLRVAFYARVSTDFLEQLNSLENQKKYFTEYIGDMPNWEFAGGYIDEGLSGVTTKKREKFNEMIEDALCGQFDLIVTKEVSRFARNTLDSIQYTRQLLSNGVAVYFQNDNINTLDEDSEFRLTIMASMAQDESRKISSRVRWGHHQAIKNGVVLGNSNIFGYRKADKRLYIVEEQAPIVRELFELYATVSARLKSRFPKIKVGGYGSLGFMGLNRLDAPDIYKDSIAYAENFLAYQKAEGGVVDFFTWYCFAETPEELALHARYARSVLDGQGFKRAASHVVGFNMDAASGGAYRGYAADLLASLIVAQRGGIDMLIFEDARPFGEKNSLYSLAGDGMRFTSARGALSAFGRLRALGTAVESLGDSRRELYSLAAIDGSSAALAVAAREYSGKLEIRLKNSDYKSFSVRRIFEDEECRSAERCRDDIPLAGNKISLSLEGGDVYLLEFKS